MQMTVESLPSCEERERKKEKEREREEEKEKERVNCLIISFKRVGGEKVSKDVQEESSHLS